MVAVLVVVVMVVMVVVVEEEEEEDVVVGGGRYKSRGPAALQVLQQLAALFELRCSTGRTWVQARKCCTGTSLHT